jgi:hypothetical protein
LASLTVLAGDVGTAVTEAVGAGIVETFDGVLRFTHILIRDELYPALKPERRSRYHRAAAANERDPVLAVPHWLAGGQPGDSDQVFTVVALALHRENARFAYEDAASLGHRALDAVVFSPRQGLSGHSPRASQHLRDRWRCERQRDEEDRRGEPLGAPRIVRTLKSATPRRGLALLSEPGATEDPVR